MSGYGYGPGISFGGGMADTHYHVVRVAMKRGESKRGNQSARVGRAGIPSNGLFGQAPECNGCKYQLLCIGNGQAPPLHVLKETVPCIRVKSVACVYHHTAIIDIDLEKKRITTHDFGGWHTNSTTWNFSAFKHACQRHVQGVPRWVYDEFEKWTVGAYFSRWIRCQAQKEAVAEMNIRFAAPWADDGWFYWERYDEKLAKKFFDSITFLRRDSNYRYFKFDWTDGNWGYHFIDDDAKRRWQAREKRRKRGEVHRAVCGDADGASGGGRASGVHDRSGE